jgi:putative flippase GtrA
MDGELLNKKFISIKSLILLYTTKEFYIKVVQKCLVHLSSCYLDLINCLFSVSLSSICQLIAYLITQLIDININFVLLFFMNFFELSRCAKKFILVL